MKKYILMIVTGSIAAIKIFELINRLKSEGFKIGIILTQASQQWISKKALKNIDDIQIFSEQEELDAIQHTIQSSSTTAIVITAASANFIKQLVYQDRAIIQYIRNEFKKPIIIAPAMNVMMWQHPAVQRNTVKLINQGFYLVGPAIGKMSCGDYGYGRLLEPQSIANEVIAIINGKISANSQVNPPETLFENAQLPKEKNISNKKLLLMIPGGRDMVYTYSLISSLRSSGWNVTCAVSDEVKEALPLAGLATISNNSVYHQHYQEDVQGMEHIRLSENNDVLLIAPATRHFVAEMARGGAQDFLGCIYLATKKPVFLIPTLDVNEKPNLEDLATLKSDGVHIIDLKPDTHLYEKTHMNLIVKNFNHAVSGK